VIGISAKQSRRYQPGRTVRGLGRANENDRAEKTEDQAEDLQRGEAVAFHHEMGEYRCPDRRRGAEDRNEATWKNCSDQKMIAQVKPTLMSPTIVAISTVRLSRGKGWRSATAMTVSRPATATALGERKYERGNVVYPDLDRAPGRSPDQRDAHVPGDDPKRRHARR